MGLFHSHLVSLCCVLLIVQAVASFVMVGTVTDSRTSLAGVPSWDIKFTSDAHVSVIVVLVERLAVPDRCLPTLLCGASVLRRPYWCWMLPSKRGCAPVPSCPSSYLSSLASFPGSLKSWRWSCGCGRWSWGYGFV